MSVDVWMHLCYCRFGGDQKVSAELVVSVYRNRNAQTHFQTLVASRCSLTPQTFDFPRVLTHAGQRVIRRTREEEKKNGLKRKMDA